MILHNVKIHGPFIMFECYSDYFKNILMIFENNLRSYG